MIEKEIVLDKVILLYDIENVVSKISQSRLREDNLDQCIQMQADDTEQDLGITGRSVDKYTNIVRSRMSAYIKEYEGGVIKLQFPDGWRECVFPDLVSSVHDYIVSMSLYEWLRITLPQEAQIYLEQADESYRQIKSCLTARKMGSVYRPLQPF